MAPRVGRAAACRALDVPRAWLYRQLQEATGSVVGEARPSPARALDAGERSAVLELLHSERFVDRSPSDVRDPAGRGNLPVLDPHDVPDPGGERGGAGAARSVAAPAVSEAGAAGDGSQPGVELGHQQAAGAGEVDVFLSVRDSGYLQPVRGGVDGGASGEQRSWLSG